MVSRSAPPPVLRAARMRPMKFVTGVAVGFAVGYYLGTNADQQRREQVREMADRVAASEQVQSVLEATEQQRTVARKILSGTLKLSSKGLRAAASNGDRRA